MEVEMKISEDAKPMASETTKEVNMTTSTNIVNRIPPSTSSSRKHPHSNSKHAGSRAVKRRGSFGSRQEASSSSNDGSSGRDRETSSQRRTYRASSPKRCKPMDLEEVFEQLDPNQPDEARRIFQRRKMLQKGKNTLGYQNYLTQVPKVTRQPRSMKTPATPDPTLKISAKRWQGLVKAWYVCCPSSFVSKVGATSRTFSYITLPVSWRCCCLV
jgi:Histone RNA hairpin-binding protein RNA-binding domain